VTLRSRRRPPDAFFSPASVAVIGATEANPSVGRTVVANLASFRGKVYPVNPKRDSVLGRRAYPAINAVPGPVDLEVIATPAETVPAIVAECAAVHVPAAIIISARFKEAGPRGPELEREIRKARGSMRIIGPNCLGLMATLRGLNATFAASMAREGSIGFLSQSGALCTAILDWSLRRALTRSDEVLDAALRGWGVLRVRRIGDLFYMAEVLAKQPRPRGPRLAIVTNAGGAAVLATDALIAEGGELAELPSPQTPRSSPWAG
jgi:acyl-CoA synthetase (NDP forming)